jgi:3-oxoacyl-[acyl-carrier-protein] synthase II
MKLTLKDGEVNGDGVDYINTHGTSTPAGDINELKAIKIALGEDYARKVSISSSKSMTGHLLGGAGGLEAIVTVKALETGIIPPTINIENLDPECDLDVTPNVAKERPVRAAMSNSFGFGGTNATLLFKAL